MGKVLHKTLSTWGRLTLAMDMGIVPEGWRIMSQSRLDGIRVHSCEGQDQMSDSSLGRGMFHWYLWEREGPSYLEKVQMRPDLLLRQRRQRAFSGRGVVGHLIKSLLEGLRSVLSRRARVWNIHGNIYGKVGQALLIFSHNISSCSSGETAA